MRQLNRALLLDLVRAHGQISRADLTKLTQLAKPTVYAIADDLVLTGHLREAGRGEASSTGGRRPTLLEFEPRAELVVGVDIAAHLTVISLADGRGSEISRAEIATPPEVAALPGLLKAAVKELFRPRDVDRRRLVGIGVSVPGLVEPSSGKILLAPVLGWDDVQIAEPLSAAMGVPVFVHNSVQAIGVAEQREGAAVGGRTIAVLYEGGGVGAALVSDGRIFHGSTGIAGEIGHIRVPGNREACKCGGTGCLETLVSGPAVARRAKATLGLRVSADDPRTSAFGLLATRHGGAPGVPELLAEVGAEIGAAAAWLINLWNPDVVLIAGGFVEAGNALLEPLIETALTESLAQSREGLRIAPSTLGREAAVRGAVLVALQASDRSARIAFGLPELA